LFQALDFVIKKTALIILISIMPLMANNSTLTTKAILDDMCDAIEKIKTCTYKLHTLERVDKRFDEINSFIKINTNPRKLYLINPSKKLEVLYIESENNNDAIVNPGKFPFITLYLNPHNQLMRKNQHHSIDDLGFQFIADMIKSSIKSNVNSFDKTFLYTGNTEWEGKLCYKIYCEFKDFKYINYTLTKNETVREIALKFGCGEYRIVEKNDIAFDATIKKGAMVKVPNMYANKTLIYIDIFTKLPIQIKIFDDAGLYEVYEFRDIQINKGFAKDEFLTSNKQYNFK
jgi:hypothetical protein